MVDLIRRWAEAMEAVRAVILTGSQARKGALLDELSDLDVALFVDDPEALEASGPWYDAFGDVLVSIPESFDELGQEIATRLVVYDDGARIDFMLFPADMLRVIAILPELPPWLDAGYQVLYDPENRTGTMVPPSGRGFAGRPPDAAELRADVEEFLWETLVVAKELARGNAVAAAYSAESVMRHGLLRRMLGWTAGAGHGWSRIAGPAGRGLEALLPPALLERARAGATGWVGGEAWDELQRLVDLYTELARRLATDLGCEYPGEVEQGVRVRLAAIREHLA